MKITTTVNWACGCREERAFFVDGRSARTPAGRQAAAKLAAAEYRRYITGDDGRCMFCILAENKARRGAIHPAFAAWSFALPDAALRAVARVAGITGGTISRSPKSQSVYVTWTAGAWRVSDHAWPSRWSNPVLTEHRAGRFFVARLRPDWLARELK